MATIDFDSEKGGNGQPGGVQSVDRALQILEILSRDGHAGVSEIAEEIGIHKSSVSRLLGSLVSREMVHRTATGESTSWALASCGLPARFPAGSAWSARPGQCWRVLRRSSRRL